MTLEFKKYNCPFEALTLTGWGFVQPSIPRTDLDYTKWRKSPALLA